MAELMKLARMTGDMLSSLTAPPRWKKLEGFSKIFGEGEKFLERIPKVRRRFEKFRGVSKIMYIVNARTVGLNLDMHMSMYYLL